MADLTDLATVRQAITRLASVSDAEVGRLITEATSIIEGYCNRTFGQATFTETYDATGSGHLWLRQKPVVSITSITVGIGTNTHVLDSSQYQVDNRTGELRGVSMAQWFPSDGGYPPNPFGYGFQAIQVVYVAGYGTIPGAVSGRCLALVNRAAAALAADPAVKSKTLGDLSYSLADATSAMVLTNDDRRILAPWRVYAMR